jgi:hypothetical protein
MSENEGDKPDNGQNGAGDEEEVIFPEEESAEAAEEPTELD